MQYRFPCRRSRVRAPSAALRKPRSSGVFCLPVALTDQFLERGVVAYRVEVRVLGGERGGARRTLDGEPEVLDRVGRPSGKTLAARHVVKQPVVLGVSLDQRTTSVCGLGVLACVVERPERRPDLKTSGFVRLPRRATEGNKRRPRLLGERRALDIGRDEDQRADGRLQRLAVELEPGTAALHEVELLVSILPTLVVLIDDSVARLATGPGVDAEGPDTEVVADWSRRTAAVADLVDLVEVRHCVATHRASCIVVLGNPGYELEASD